jgi:hypothetical protein
VGSAPAQPGVYITTGSTSRPCPAAPATSASVALKSIGPRATGCASDHENTTRTVSAPELAMRGHCWASTAVGAPSTSPSSTVP